MGETVSDKPHEKPSCRQLLTGAGAAGAGRIAPSVGSTLTAASETDAPFGAIAPVSHTKEGSR